MDCSDFQAKLDLYIDGMLGQVEAEHAAHHTSCCRPCEDIVTGYQQIRALLVTAVADRAAAVDVSGLWQSIAHRVEPVPASVTPLAVARQARWLHAARSAVRRITPLQAGTLAAMAAAAVLAFGIGTGGDTTSTAEVARGGLLQSRRVRIDSMEVAAGHTVSTWVKPRTKTRVIWVANNAGFAVSNASHDR